MITAHDIHPGMWALSRDGERLGQVAQIDDAGFSVGSGAFFHDDYPARFADVREVCGEALVLSHDAEWFHARALLDLPSAPSDAHAE